jgi:hypothetical protein
MTIQHINIETMSNIKGGIEYFPHCLLYVSKAIENISVECNNTDVTPASEAPLPSVLDDNYCAIFAL